MKTAVSIPDEVFNSAEQLAKRLGKSRSELYAIAIKDYLARNNDQLVRASLDKIYSHNDSGIDPALESMQLKSVARDQW